MAKKEEKSLATQEKHLPSNISNLEIEDLEKDAGAGLENIGANDIALPFLVVLQAGSPQVKKGDQKVEGAVEGDVLNTVTQDLYSGDEGIYVVPVFYKKSFVEWKPRESGGGFVAQHEDESIFLRTKKNEKNQDILETGNVIVTTAYHYGLLINPVSGDYQNVVIAMSSTQLKKSRRWNAIMSGLKMARKNGTKFTPPIFSHMYKLTTEAEKNELGQWCGWKIEIQGVVPSKEIYEAAKQFIDALKSGAIREAVPPQIVDTTDPDNIPF